MPPIESKPNGAIPQAIPVNGAAGPTPTTQRIDAALASHATTLETEPRIVKLAELQLDPLNAHKHSDEYIDTLAANIAANGLIEEPEVHSDQITGRLTVHIGNARVMALLRLGRKEACVRCVKGAFTAEQIRDRAFIHNIVKEDVDPLAFGIYCKDEMDRSGRSARDLAKLLSNQKDPSTITRAVALVNKLTPDILVLIRSNRLPPAVARLLTGLKDDDAKRRFARMYVEGLVKSGAELAAAIKAEKSGQPAGASAGTFTCEEEGCKITVVLALGGNLSAAETALKTVLEDLRKHGKRGFDHWKTFLSRKKTTVKKMSELKAAQDALTRHGNGGNTNS